MFLSSIIRSLSVLLTGLLDKHHHNINERPSNNIDAVVPTVVWPTELPGRIPNISTRQQCINTAFGPNLTPAEVSQLSINDKPAMECYRGCMDTVQGMDYFKQLNCSSIEAASLDYYQENECLQNRYRDINVKCCREVNDNIFQSDCDAYQYYRACRDEKTNEEYSATNKKNSATKTVDEKLLCQSEIIDFDINNSTHIYRAGGCVFRKKGFINIGNFSIKYDAVDEFINVISVDNFCKRDLYVDAMRACEKILSPVFADESELYANFITCMNRQPVAKYFYVAKTFKSE